MSRVLGSPSPEAAALIEQIYAFALRQRSDDEQENLTRARDLHHIVQSARDALNVGLAVINSGRYEPGHVGYSSIASYTGLDPTSVRRYVLRGQKKLQEMQGSGG